jgi:hypothetical protein
MNELQHHGVKGMKWGVNKRSNASVSDGTKPDNTKSSNSKKVTKGKNTVNKILKTTGKVALGYFATGAIVTAGMLTVRAILKKKIGTNNSGSSTVKQIAARVSKYKPMNLGDGVTFYW